jgi:uncharacterized protein DUF4145
MGTLSKNVVDGTATERQVYCNSCGGNRTHTVLKSVKVDLHWDEGDEHGNCIDWYNDCEILECKGCNTITFKHEVWDSETGYDYDGPIIATTFYPNRNLGQIKEDVEWSVPDNLRGIYKEIISSFNMNNFILSAAGLRALIEGICAEQGIKKGMALRPVEGGGEELKKVDALDGKINGLCENGILSKRNTDILHGFRFLGNDAVHKLDRPNKEELQIAIRILEHLIDEIYVIPNEGERLKKLSETRKAKAVNKK